MTGWRALLIVGLAWGCGGPGTTGPDPADLVGTTWLAEEIDGAGVLEEVRSTLTFSSLEQAAGDTCCNRYFGSLTLEGDGIRFGPLGSTRMACPPPVMEQEIRFTSALERVRRWERQGDRLTLFGEGPEPLVRFTRGEAEE